MPTVYTWFITGISIVGVVVTYVIHNDIPMGTYIAQGLADFLAGVGYTVSVVSPEGAPKIFAAPEIDAASATTAIALLTGILLLVGERSRTRRS